MALSALSSRRNMRNISLPFYGYFSGWYRGYVASKTEKHPGTIVASIEPKGAITATVQPKGSILVSITE